jgi:UDP-N-acetylmuramyl pentapeptide phosphotransferase/UDP-N-acetylglucosamine-1-phosphate transferase
MSETLYFNIFILNLVLSFFINFLILYTKRYHINFTSDNTGGLQKIHSTKVPRIGGLSLFLTLLFSNLFIKNYYFDFFNTVLIASLPLFFIGFIEDIKKDVDPKIRLFFAFLSSWLIIYLTKYSINSVDIEFIDVLINLSYVSMILSMLSIAAFSNAINIIDGLNGLALNSVLFIFLTIFAFSVIFDDELLSFISIAIIAAIIGLLVFNFPNGKIFLGDAGAYFLGFLTAFILIVLPERIEQINPFTSLLIIIYPLYEMVRSFLRRLSKGLNNTVYPDFEHLHSLIFKSLSKKSKFIFFNQNAQSSLICVFFTFSNCLWALCFYKSKILLLLGILVFIVFYEVCYFKIKQKSIFNVI